MNFEINYTIEKMKELNIETLDERLDIIIDKINSGEITKVVFLLGAGVSVASGIPDFRSSDGFYNSIDPSQFSIPKKKDLEMIKKNPAYLLTAQMFESNQLPLLEAKRSFIIELLEKKYKPTLTHWFLRLCHERNILHHIYTQNIDNLEKEVGIPSHKITQLHGTIGKAVCYFCNRQFPINDFYDHIKNNIRNVNNNDNDNKDIKSTELLCNKCQKPGIKPDIVMFGETIKENKFNETKDAELLIVSGTSLQVFPANKIPLRVPIGCSRMVINNELPLIPDFMQPDTLDLFIEGKCDESFLEFASYLGWTDDLIKLVKKNKKNISKDSLDLMMNDDE
jgi:NAD-dependent SIR2 family protein deacetylase